MHSTWNLRIRRLSPPAILWSLVLGFFSTTDLNAQAPIDRASLLEKVEVLSNTIRAARESQAAGASTNNDSSSEILELQWALDSYLEGNEDQGDAQLSLLADLGRNFSWEKSIPAKTKKQLLINYMLQHQTEHLRNGYRQMLLNLHGFVWNLDKQIREQKLDTWSTMGRAVNFGKKKSLAKALVDLTESLTRLQRLLLDDTHLKNFAHHKDLWLLHLQLTMEAYGNRWNTAELRAKNLRDALKEFEKSGHFYPDQQKQNRLNSEWFDQEGSEEQFRNIVYNREVWSVAIYSAVVAGELTCAVATGGLCLATAPKALAAARTATQAWAVSQSAMNLTDRYRFNGMLGLVNMASVVDTLLIIALSPRPSVAAMKWAPQIPGAPLKLNAFLANNMQPLRTLAGFQHQAGFLLLAGGTAFSSWQFFNAKNISKDLAKEGIQSSEAEIRVQAASYLAMSLLGGFTAYRNYKEGLAKHPDYAKLMQEATLKQSLSKTWTRLKGIFPPKALYDIYTSLSSRELSKLRKAWRFGKHTFMGAYGTINILSATWISYSYADASFMRNATPLPDLKPGEIALVLNGFSTEDLLHYVFLADSAHEMEIEKYQKNQNLFFDEFSSPEDLMQKIRAYGNRGKIKYLKIAAHGMPGKLYAQGVGFEAESQGASYIDAAFLERHKSSYQKHSRKAMADNAHVRIYSCLVGADLDKDMTYHPTSRPKTEAPDFYAKDAGTRFMRSFGEAFLVNGGVIDSSRRVIIALEAGYKDKMQEFFSIPKENRVRFFNKISTQIGNIDQQLFLSSQQKKASDGLMHPLSNSNSSRSASLGIPTLTSEEGLNQNEATDLNLEILENMWHNVRATYTRIWTLIDNFGINIEGSWAADRHRTDHFEKIPE